MLRWHLRPLTRFGRFVLCSLVAISTATPPGFVQAQVTVNYGPGEYGVYRRRLAEFMGTAGEIAAAAGIGIKATYCDAAEYQAVGARLAAARVRFATLKRDYARFKIEVDRQLAVAGILALFTAANEQNLGSPNFWRRADQEVLSHTEADLSAAEAAFRKSAPVDCNPPRRTTSPPPPPPRAPAKPNPLAGLTRPTVPSLPAIPTPPAFCTEAERTAWIRANLQPLMDQIITASNALRNYGGDVLDALGKVRRSGDSASVRVLEQEFAWEDRTHKELDDVYWRFARFRDGLMVIDCSRPRTQERPVTPRPPVTPPLDSLRPAPRRRVSVDSAPPKVGQGLRWRLGAGLEYARFESFPRVARDQANLTSFTGGKGSTGIGVSIGVDWNRWSCDLSGHKTSLRYEQTLSAAKVNVPIRSMGSLDGYFGDASCGRRWPVWRTELETFGGATLAVDRLRFDNAFSNGLIIPGTRSLQNWKSNVGIALNFPLTTHIGARASVTQTTAWRSADADAHTRLGFGLQYRF